MRRSRSRRATARRRPARRRLLAAAALATGLPVLVGWQGTPPAGAATTVPGAGSCPMFPADNVWNTPVTNLPVSAHSATWLASMDASGTLLHPDYGPSGDPTTPYGIPYQIVTPGTTFVHITFQYADESDPGPYPFGPSTPIEGGQGASGDRHAIMIDPATCTLYELWDAQYSSSGSTAGSGAIWNLRSDALRPAGWTSADAAGLPIMPGLVDYDEVAAGAMDHAIRVTAQCTQQSYLWPARHEAGQADAACPPMGARFRLDAGFTLPASACSAMCQTVLTTMKTYGLIVADNGSNWYFQGTADTRWTDTEVDQLKQIPASDFVAVDESSLEVNADSGQATGVQAPGPGYRLVAADGGVFGFGTAGFFGSAGGLRLQAPVVGTADTADDGGYWMVAADGGIFAYGDAAFHGSMGGRHLAAPIVGMAATADGGGYWLVARDGGIFAYGDAAFHGSMGGRHLAAPIVGMAATADGGGYWLVAADGGIFAYGDAAFEGSTGGVALAKPVVGMRALPGGGGYWLVAADGGVFPFGAANFHGSMGGDLLDAPLVAMG